MRRLIWGFAGRTYHIVGNIMHWLICINTFHCWKIIVRREPHIIYKLLEVPNVQRIRPKTWSLLTMHQKHSILKIILLLGGEKIISMLWKSRRKSWNSVTRLRSYWLKQKDLTFPFKRKYCLLLGYMKTKLHSKFSKYHSSPHARYSRLI